MKMTFEFDDDEYERAQHMLDWHRYFIACIKVYEYCRDQVKDADEVDIVFFDLLSMVSFVGDETSELERSTILGVRDDV